MQELVILIGPPGSGKTTYCRKEFPNHSRVNQDDQGKNHINLFRSYLRDGVDIIVDRMNFSVAQRARYIIPAIRAGYFIKIVQLNTDFGVCIKRIIERDDHPTIPQGSYFTAAKCVTFFEKNFEHVEDFEYDEYETIE